MYGIAEDLARERVQARLAEAEKERKLAPARQLRRAARMQRRADRAQHRADRAFARANAQLLA